MKTAAFTVLCLCAWGCLSMDTSRISETSENEATDFTLPDQDGNPVTLSETAKANRGVVLAFYPKDDSKN